LVCTGVGLASNRSRPGAVPRWEVTCTTLRPATSPAEPPRPCSWSWWSSWAELSVDLSPPPSSWPPPPPAGDSGRGHGSTPEPARARVRGSRASRSPARSAGTSRSHEPWLQWRPRI
jgi:hypothetical protein